MTAADRERQRRDLVRRPRSLRRNGHGCRLCRRPSSVRSHPGSAANVTLPNGVNVAGDLGSTTRATATTSSASSSRCHGGQNIPLGNTTIALTGTTVINGAFQAWVDRNNRGLSAFQAPFLQEDSSPSVFPPPRAGRSQLATTTRRRRTPSIPTSGRGPTRDGRIKPEIATVGTSCHGATLAQHERAVPGELYM